MNTNTDSLYIIYSAYRYTIGLYVQEMGHTSAALTVRFSLCIQESILSLYHIYYLC